MSIYFNVIERTIEMRHWTVMLSISMSWRRRNLRHCGEQSMQGRRHRKEVQEDVHVIPRSTFFTLITKNEYQLLFLLSEVQGCLVDPSESPAYTGGFSLASRATRTAGLVGISSYLLCGVQQKGGQQRLLEEEVKSCFTWARPCIASGRRRVPPLFLQEPKICKWSHF